MLVLGLEAGRRIFGHGSLLSTTVWISNKDWIWFVNDFEIENLERPRIPSTVTKKLSSYLLISKIGLLI